jgi:hypothetical protein
MLRRVVWYILTDVSEELSFIPASLSKLYRYTPWRCLGGRRNRSYSFLTSALDGCEWSVTPRPRFTPGERTRGTHRIGGWVGPRAGLDAGDRRKILCPCRGSNLDPSSATTLPELPLLPFLRTARLIAPLLPPSSLLCLLPLWSSLSPIGPATALLCPLCSYI